MAEQKRKEELSDYAGGWIQERKGTDIPGFPKFCYIVIAPGVIIYCLRYINGAVNDTPRGELVRQFDRAALRRNGFMYFVAALIAYLRHCHSHFRLQKAAPRLNGHGQQAGQFEAIDGADYWIKMVKCQHACPVHTNACGYVTAIAEGRYEDAYRMARATNPFASICGRVCGAPCEANCRRGDLDQPISIRALKRFVTDKYGPESGDAAMYRAACDMRMLPPNRGNYERDCGGRRRRFGADSSARSDADRLQGHRL